MNKEERYLETLTAGDIILFFILISILIFVILFTGYDPTGSIETNSTLWIDKHFR